MIMYYTCCDDNKHITLYLAGRGGRIDDKNE